MKDLILLTYKIDIFELLEDFKMFLPHYTIFLC